MFTILTAPKDYETTSPHERAAIFALFHLIQEKNVQQIFGPTSSPKGPTYFTLIFEKFIRFLQKIKTASKAFEFVFAGQRHNNFLPQISQGTCLLVFICVITISSVIHHGLRTEA